MNSGYKEALQNLYKAKYAKSSEKFYAKEIFGLDWLYCSWGPKNPARTEVQAMSKANESGLVEKISHQELGDFQEGPVSFPKKDADYTKAVGCYEGLLSQKTLESRYHIQSGESRKSPELKVLFVSDTLKEVDSNVEEPFQEFTCLYEESVAGLFFKMVAAMQLSPEDFVLSGIQRELEDGTKVDNTKCVEQEIECLQPRLVICLGVSASNALLEKTQRLKDIHGQVFHITRSSTKTQLMPLFSPNLLSTATHMKKVTWEDMQKAMKLLE